jgi:hypothetical protein
MAFSVTTAVIKSAGVMSHAGMTPMSAAFRGSMGLWRPSADPGSTAATGAPT